MELPQPGFFEELLQAPRRESWSAAFATGNEEFFSHGWNFDSFDENVSLVTPSSTFAGYSASIDPCLECPFSVDQTYSFVDEPAVPEIDGSYNGASVFPSRLGDYPSMAEDEELGLISNDSFKERNNGCKIEMELATSVQAFNMSSMGEKKSKNKKLEGQPSKNLMAERRRRKRLNDRLSMLRSIVPKISKMDRTSILGDTIDYMKELIERINKLREEESEDGTNEVNFANFLNDLKPNAASVRNSSKFQVDRQVIDTRVDICCSSRPRLLLSTVNTLEALGLEIQQCVISCFNDFSMQASCSEVAENRTLITPEDIKQALLRTAGYGGRCL